MLNRKLLILISILLALSPNFYTPAHSAAIAGTKCAKVNTTKTVANIKYSCVKSGKKLVWNKGVSIKPSAMPTPSATPTPIPTNSAAPTPTPTTKPVEVAKIGDSCNKEGDAITSNGIQLICRQIANRKFSYFELSTTFSTATNPKSPDSLATCRLTDQRPTPYQPEGTQITYPIKPGLFSVKSGVEKIAVVGFDFSDSPGEGSPLDIYGGDLKRSADFFNWYSNGKVKLEFTTHDKWIRLSQPSRNYETGEHFSTVNGNLTVLEMAHEFQLAVKKYINIDGYTSIWFVYPKNIQTITQNFGLAAGYDNMPSFYGVGPSHYLIELPLWTYYIHEMLHEQGLQGHSPKAPWRFGVLLNGNGYTAGMNSWDELSVDWMSEDEIYCIDKSRLKPVTVNLAPIERQQSGVHSVMIKLDNHRALVIESHRAGDFAQGMPDYGYGVTLQLVDTTKETTWNDEKATSVYLQIVNYQRYGPEFGTRINNKLADDSGVNMFNGIGVSGARWGLDQNYLMFEGEKFTFEGITIEFVKSGNTDQISIS